MRTNTTSSVFSQNAGLFEATQNLKAEAYLKAFDKVAQDNLRYIDSLLLKAAEQACKHLSALREKIASASIKEWLTYSDISEFFPVILDLALLYMEGEDFQCYGTNLTLINTAFNKAVRNQEVSVRVKKENDPKQSARDLRKIFKNKSSEDLAEVICWVSEAF